jgi:hypothetical protein
MGAKSASVGFLVQPVTSLWPRARGHHRGEIRLVGRPKSSPAAVLRAGRGIPQRGRWRPGRALLTRRLAVDTHATT